MNNKELTQHINDVFNTHKNKKKNDLLKEQQELIDKYNNDSMNEKDLKQINFFNFYINYFDNINDIISDILSKKNFIKEDRLFYIGITFIFISILYFILNKLLII
jgi:hypothetical protein